MHYFPTYFAIDADDEKMILSLVNLKKIARVKDPIFVCLIITYIFIPTLHSLDVVKLLLISLYLPLCTCLPTTICHGWYLILAYSYTGKNILSQPNSTSTQVGIDKVMGWPTHTTTPQKLLSHFQATQEADFRYATLF